MTASNLPPDWAVLARVVDRQSPSARELFHYALVLLLVEDGKAQIVERRTVDAQEWVTVRTVAAELFSIIKPNESDAMLDAPIRHDDSRPGLLALDDVPGAT